MHVVWVVLLEDWGLVLLTKMGNARMFEGTLGNGSEIVLISAVGKACLTCR